MARQNLSPSSAAYAPATVVPASGDATGATDAAAIQAALTAGGYVLLKIGATYYLNAGLSLDPSKATFDFRGARINAIGAITALTIAQPSSTNTSDLSRYWLGLGHLSGDGTAGSIGIRRYNYIAQLSAFSGVVEGFDVNHQSEANTWCVKFIGTTFRDAVTCNYKRILGGENDVLVGCTIGNTGVHNGTGISTSAGNVTMVGGSIDGIPNRSVEVLAGGNVTLLGVHTETLAGTTNNVYYTTGAGSTIRHIGGQLVLSGTSTTTAFLADASSSGIFVDQVDYSGPAPAGYPFAMLLTGPGRVRVGYVYSDNASHPVAGASAQNMLVDGGFEQATVKDWTNGGTSNAIVSTDDHHSGAQSLKLAPTAGQYVDASITITVNPGDYVKFNFWGKSALGASTDAIIVKLIYQDVNNSNTGFQSQTLTSAGFAAWTLQGIRLGLAPAGTRKAIVHLTRASAGTTSDGVGAFYFDDCLLTIE